MGSRESSGGRCRQREARSTGTRARMNTATGLKLLGLRGSLGRGILRNQAQKRIPGSARCLSTAAATSTPGETFRALVSQAAVEKKPLQIVGAINAYSALMAEKKGIKALYLSGGGVALSSLGVPDLSVTTLEDVMVDARRITRACPGTPLLVDIDTGFGTTIFNVRRTIEDLESIGVAAVHMEDQVVAKRCGHRPNKQIVSTQEMVHRITAAVDARKDPSFFIMSKAADVVFETLEKEGS